MAKVNKRRLLKLADFLETIPREKFAIVAWQSEPATKPEGGREGSCGFAGCAVGWAVHAKLFRGLGFVERRSFWTEQKHLEPTYGDHTAYGVCSALFGLPHGADDHEPSDEVRHLFSPDGYEDIDRRDEEGDPNPTPKQVAKRIRAFLRNDSTS